MSPALKRFGEVRVNAGERLLVVDLAGCTGMDSTFMGTLAGLAIQLEKAGGGVVQVAGVNPRNRQSLEDLGLDCLLEIEPEAAVWRDRVEAVRGDLRVLDEREFPEVAEAGARHVLEAHRVLADSSAANRDKFRGVIEVLEAELADKQRGGRNTNPATP